MNTTNIIRYNLIIAFVTAFFTANVLAATDMPRLQFGIGDVKAIGLDGKTRPLKKGDVLLPGEKLVTGPGAMAQLRIFKQGVVVLRDKGQLELKPPVNGKFGVSLDQGFMRTVTKLGYKLGKIDVITPGANIAVQSGDVLTGVGIGKANKITHNQVLDGKITITTGAGKKFADIGKVLKIMPADGGITVVTVVDKVPDSMQLRLPNPTIGVSVEFKGNTTRDIASSFQTDQTKIAVLSPAGGPVSTTRPVTGTPITVIIATRPATDPVKLIDPPFKVTVDTNLYDPRLMSGSIADKEVVENLFVLRIGCSICKQPTLTAFSKEKVDTSVVKPKEIVLTPITSIVGLTTLSSTLIPEIKVVTFEPTRIISTSTNFDPVLTNTIKTSTLQTTTTTTTSPIKTTLCCSTKTLTLIK